MSARRQLEIALLASALAACGPEHDASVDASARDASSSPAPATVGEGPIVATVDGEPITLGEVEWAARETGLSPLDALRRLEEERVLHRRALAAGIDPTEADRGARRAAVQALLRERVEDAVGPETVTDAEVMARYDATRASFAQPERRTSVHVLAQVPEDADEATARAAEQFARRVITELSAAADPASSADGYATDAAEDGAFHVLVEHLPPASRRSPLEAPYLDALFSRDTPGVVGEPARTSNGFHVIVITAIDPAFRVSIDEAEPMLRAQLWTEHRGAALDALDRALRRRIAVSIDERVARDVLAADLFADDPGLGTGGP